MKIAVLFFGRSKHFKRAYTSLIASIGNGHTIDVFYSADNEPQEAIEEFIETCKPKALCNDKIIETLDFTKYPNTNAKIAHINYHTLPRHFINKKRVFTLMEEYMHSHDITYTMVISSRLDIEIDTLPMDTPAENTIYIPESYDYHGINDRFAIGNVETMKIYMMIYDTATFLLESKLSIPHPESLALANLKYHTICIKRFKLSTKLLR